MINTQKKAAVSVGVSTRTIRNWEKKGLQRDEHGNYNPKQLDEFDIARKTRTPLPLKISTVVLELKITIAGNKVVHIDSVELCKDQEDAGNNETHESDQQGRG